MEMHLVTIHRLLHEFRPKAIVVDPISAFLNAGSGDEVKALMMRLIDFLKSQQLTAFLTALVPHGRTEEVSNMDVSSLIDTWISVRDEEVHGERLRALNI